MASVGAPPRGQEDPSKPPVVVGSPAWALPGGVALIVSLLAAGFALLSSVVIPLFGRTNGTDWGLFFATLVVLTPGAVVAGRLVARATIDAGGPAALSALAAWATAALLAVGVLARIVFSLGGQSSIALLLLVPAWGAGLAFAVRGGRRGRHLGVDFLRVDAPLVCAVAVALGCCLVLCFLSPEVFRPLPLGASVAIAGVLTFVHFRDRSAGRLPRVLLLALDAAAVLVIILVITDVSGYVEYLRPDARTYVLGDGKVFSPQILAFAHRLHEGFWLGPTNDVLHGRAMLVDTWSQYGVGSIYFLAAFFQIAPLGYGALGLLSGFLTALQYALAYGLLRVAGCSRTFAIPAAAAAVLGLLLGSIGSPNDFPNTGGLRFGIPWLIVAMVVLSARVPRRRALLLLGARSLVGLASVWSFETFAYAGAIFTAVAAFEAAADGREGRRVRAFAGLFGSAAGFCVAAHVILAVGTRLLAGSWPDWSPYLAFLDAYSGQGLYHLTVAPWSPGLLIGLLYLASGIATAALLAARHRVVVERRSAVLGIAAASGLGLASLTYFVGLSQPNIVSVVSLPAVFTACLWASLLSDFAWAPRALTVEAVAAAFWIAAMVGISGWPDASAKWRRTAAANIVPDGGRGGSLRYAVRRLWHSPPSDPRAPEAQALLDRHLPPGAPALVMMAPELTVETLVRSDRVNLLPISHPEQENIIPDQAEPRVLEAIDRLRSGTLMLAQPSVFNVPATPVTQITGRLLPLQKLALRRIRERFRLRPVDRSPSPSGFVIFRLDRRR